MAVLCVSVGMILAFGLVYLDCYLLVKRDKPMIKRIEENQKLIDKLKNNP